MGRAMFQKDLERQAFGAIAGYPAAPTAPAAGARVGTGGAR
jgi:hypothetical protein